MSFAIIVGRQEFFAKNQKLAGDCSFLKAVVSYCGPSTARVVD
ncbi:hypothetical protein [Enterococcus thailandicus]|nr:hypothetical protein [Enterococcus thailandicus]MDA3966036.1 hypothetical protein [Enterococcus thailandicus]